MSDLFVSYRYWSPQKREYIFLASVIPQDALKIARIKTISEWSTIRKLQDYISDAGCVDPVILYWRRMEDDG